MVRGDVQLNAKGYVVRPFDNGENVRRQTITPFADVQVPVAGSSQEALKIPDSRTFPPPVNGVGRNRIQPSKSRNVEEYKYFRDADAETRFANDVRLPILQEDSTETGLEVIRDSVFFKSNLWALWQADSGNDLVARRYVGSSTTWTAGGTVLAESTGNYPHGLGIIGYKTHLVVLLTTKDDHEVYRSTDGVTWVAASTHPTVALLDHFTDAGEDVVAGLIDVIGGELVVIIWDQDSGTTTFFTSTDTGHTWSDEDVDIPNTSDLLGVVVYPGVDNEAKLYVLQLDGLWEVDTAPSTWTTRKIYSFPGVGGDPARKMIAVHNDQVWFAPLVDDDTPAKVITLNTRGGIYEFNPHMGLDQGDGIVADALGQVMWMKSSGEFLFMSVGGGKAGRQARIWCHNGLGWHTVRKHGTADQRIDWMDVSSRDDTTTRLHYAVRTGTSASDSKFLAEPLVNPQSGTSIKRESQGYVERPEIDGGMPTDSATWVQALIDAVDLSGSTSNEYIGLHHGLNGADRNTTDLGDFLSGTKTLKYASGAGEAGVSDAHKEWYHRGSTDTNTPKGRALQIKYMKRPEKLRQFTFVVDIEATAALDDLTTEDVITNLEAAETLATFPTFQYPGLTQTYVSVKPIQWGDIITNPGGAIGTTDDTNAQRTGFVTVTVEEPVA